MKISDLPPPAYKPPTLSKQGSLLSRSYSLTQSATNVISRTLTNVGLNKIPYRVNDTEISCSICLEAMDEEQGDLHTVSACSHVFHKTCIAKWKKESRKCPCCRGPLSEEIGPTNSFLHKLQNLPEENVLLPLQKSDICVNVIFCAVGIAYSLSLLSLYIVGFVLILLIFFIASIYISRENLHGNNIFHILCVIIGLSLGFSFLACCLALGGVLEILYVLFRTLKFYMMILKCKIRWIDAASFIIQRTFDVNAHLFDQE